MRIRLTAWAMLLPILTSFTGCANQAAAKFDYTALREAKPLSLLVLPPVNDATDINATPSVLAQVTYPLAESGYYVMPVTLVNETFRQNGLNNAAEMHAVAPAKLREIFGADAALYINVKRYGTTYTVLNSAAVVAADAKLVDLRTGTTLWTGSASASSAEQNNNSGGGLAGALVAALVKQILNSTMDVSHQVAGTASARLLSAGRPNGLLYGPRSPLYGKDNLN